MTGSGMQSCLWDGNSDLELESSEPGDELSATGVYTVNMAIDRQLVEFESFLLVELSSHSFWLSLSSSL